MSKGLNCDTMHKVNLKLLFSLMVLFSFLIGILFLAFAEYSKELDFKRFFVILGWSVLSAYPFANLVTAFKTGVIVSKFSVINKTVTPFEFWLWVCIFLVVGICLGLLNLILVFGAGMQA